VGEGSAEGAEAVVRPRRLPEIPCAPRRPC
jgi:hypothetical protein